MNELHSHLERLIASSGHRHRAVGSRITVSLGDGRRTQHIEVCHDGEDCILTTIVLNASREPERHKRELARLAWERNASQEIVTFGFDRRDRLIAEVRHPASFLDEVELDLYLRSLARAADRFEHLLTGLERF